ncbi:MAG: hypothetical protein WC829_14755 [Hyphomicrobium sp.]|jgi:hypothetical protein
MVQTSVQFTPVQVLQAARRAEAEGKMDYALQFYRHLVEQHGGTAEAQVAREGLFRIAEWRWGEARVARNREAGATGTTGNAPAASGPPPPDQRVYNVANNPQHDEYHADHQDDHHADASVSGALPQIISRQHAQANPQPTAFHERFRAARFFAHTLSGLGWVTLLSGVLAAIAGIAGFVGELSAIALLGAPLGVMLGLPAVFFGLILAVGGQLAAALFESANATLERTAMERGRVSA